MVLETVQLVLDRPRDDEPGALIYVAERVRPAKQGPIATSAVFRPAIDPTAHRFALAQLESELRAQGWQREDSPGRALIGVRFHRWRGEISR